MLMIWLKNIQVFFVLLLFLQTLVSLKLFPNKTFKNNHKDLSPQAVQSCVNIGQWMLCECECVWCVDVCTPKHRALGLSAAIAHKPELAQWGPLTCHCHRQATCLVLLGEGSGGLRAPEVDRGNQVLWAALQALLPLAGCDEKGFGASLSSQGCAAFSEVCHLHRSVSRR